METRSLEEFKASAANKKQKPSYSQISTNPYTKSLIPLISVTRYNFFLMKEFTRHAINKKKMQSEETKQSSELDSCMTHIWNYQLENLK